MCVNEQEWESARELERAQKRVRELARLWESARERKRGSARAKETEWDYESVCHLCGGRHVVCCSALQRVAVRCSVLQSIAVRRSACGGRSIVLFSACRYSWAVALPHMNVSCHMNELSYIWVSHVICSDIVRYKDVSLPHVNESCESY